MLRFLFYITINLVLATETKNEITYERKKYNKLIDEINSTNKLNVIKDLDSILNYEVNKTLFNKYFKSVQAFGPLYNKHIAFKQAHKNLVEDYYFYLFNCKENEASPSLIELYENILKKHENIDIKETTKDTMVKVGRIISEIDIALTTFINSIQSVVDYNFTINNSILIMPLLRLEIYPNKTNNHMHNSLKFSLCVIRNILRRAKVYNSYFEKSVKKGLTF